MKISGIYKIESIIKPERIYIGSAKDIMKRWWMHVNLLRKNKHHSVKLQNHFNKYGEADFKFSILLGCDNADLVKTEQYFLDSYNPYFNICKVAGSSLGIKRSEETKKKMSDALKGRNLGIHTEETYKKLSAAAMGHEVTQETRDKIRKTLTGKKHSQERINNIRKGIIKNGVSNSFLGKKHSEESRQKMSLSQKKVHERKKLERGIGLN